MLLAAALLGAGALVAGVTLVGGPADGDGCRGAGKRVEQVAALEVLRSPPPGARPAEGFEEPDSGCLDDSGEEVIGSVLTYDSPLPEAAVLSHYRAVAGDDGWSEEEPSYGEAESPGDPDAVRACFGKDIPGGPVRLSVRFESAERFMLSAESGLDGARLGC
ncbi:hypothetical protein [Streptomyces sp. NPDC001889]